jgi:hypothetical protein
MALAAVQCVGAMLARFNERGKTLSADAGTIAHEHRGTVPAHKSSVKRSIYLRSALHVERKVNSNDSRGIFSIKG